MSNSMSRQHWRWWCLGSVILLTLSASAAAAYLYVNGLPGGEAPAPATNGAPAAAAVPPQPTRFPLQIQYFCTRCHAYPPGDIFPRSAWKQEIEQAYEFFHQSNLDMQAPPIAGVIAYYEDRAPLELPPAVIKRATTPPPVHFERMAVPVLPEAPSPAISNVNLVHLFDERRLDVLACDLRAGLVLCLQPYLPAPSWQVLAHVPNPAHAEVVDLDGDGVKDILVACLGSATQTDELTGSVVWLRGRREGGFTPITLLDGVGRVADVQAAAFRKGSTLDLVVAAFGWRKTGEVLYLENRTTDWSHPRFEKHVLDDRHGAIHVAVGDLNGDGRPDIVALISQEHETIAAFLNEGNGQFQRKDIYVGPHPAYGSTGIQLVDLNGDGRLDVLYTNGDSMEKPYVLKPYHGVQWLENKGAFPFVHHPLAPLYGAYRAVAADFQGKGKLDIMAVSYLPCAGFPQRTAQNLDAVIYLEQTAPGEFARHSLESATCDHVTCVAGDIFGSGKVDLVTGNFGFTPAANALTIWRNSHPAESKSP
jgi:hypothetical protein